MRNKFITIVLSFIALPVFSQNLERLYDYDTKKWGVRDADWNIVIPCIYDEIEPTLDTVFAAKKDGRMLLFNGDGSVRVPLKYQHIQVYFNTFNRNYGLAAVTQNDKIPNSWGMIESNGKIVLPEKYQYVRAINNNLIVAKPNPDTVLQFFDRKGNILYKIPGKYIDPLNYDDTCFGVKGNDHKTRYYTEKGDLVYPDDPFRGIWTDGKRTILREKVDFNKLTKSGVIDSKGKVIIPYEFSEIELTNQKQFLARKRVENYDFQNQTLYDYNGNLLVPEGKHRISSLGERFAIIDYDTDKAGLLDENRKEILPAKYQYSSVLIADANYDEKIPDSKPKDYISWTDVTTQKQFLITKNGEIVRPKNCEYVNYFSEKHPLKVRLGDAEKINSIYKIADKKGRYLLPDTFFSLIFTLDPNVFIAQKEREGLFGFLDLRKPEATEYKFKKLGRWTNGFYSGEINGEYELFNGNFQKIKSGPFIRLQMPERKEYETFRAQKKLSGRLVAAAFRQGMDYSDFLGINEKGEEAIFTKEAEKKVAPPVKATPQKAPVEVEEAVPPPPPLQKERPLEGEEPMVVVEVRPQFPNGEAEMRKFLAKNLKYPVIALENGVQGQVIVSFIVEKDGSLTNAQIVRDIGGGCGQEALRLVNAMPKWEPGKQRGQAVRVKYTLPVSFRLE